MVTMQKKLVVLLAAVATLGLPYAGSLKLWSPSPIPGFGIFPPQLVLEPPGFNAVYFALACCAALVILAFLLVPAWFGFKPVPVPPPATPGPFPSWFYVGAVICLASWYVQWFSGSPLVKYIFTPLWWGFIAVIDGFVYMRSGGNSIFSKLPKQMFWLGVTSAIGWWAFEWLNYFVLENWVYPNSPAIFTTQQALFWFTLTYTCVFPAIFEFYTLLRTFPALEARWANGPQINLPTNIIWAVLLVGATAAFLVGYFPRPLFFIIWMASLMIIPQAMSLAGLWTPFAPIAVGNWSPPVLCALGSLCTGFFWEFWNHGSNVWHPALNPNYWTYHVPYVNVIIGFTEMPFLGYFGYLPFGVQCWVWWLVTAHLLGLPTDFDPAGLGLPGQRELAARGASAKAPTSIFPEPHAAE